MSFEQFVRVFLSTRLRAEKKLPPRGELRREVVDGEEINLFFDDPLIVGEATAHIDSLKELDKLERKAKLAAKKLERTHEVSDSVNSFKTSSQGTQETCKRARSGVDNRKGSLASKSRILSFL